MTSTQKIDKLKEFENEKAFRDFLIDYLKKRGFTDVLLTHRYGSPEQGKDIIAKFPHSLEGDDWYAFVVKLGRIGGGTTEIETIKGQIKQAFEYPYVGPKGNELKINKVKVVTNENFTQGAQTQISSSPELKVYNNFDFWWSETLIPAIDEYYPDFWLPGDAFAKAYSKRFQDKLNSEVEVRELSIRRIDDKQLQRLINIFIEPQLSETYIADEKGVKGVRRRKITINALTSVRENLLISGEQGAGKTKVLNNIASNLSTVDAIVENKQIPVKLKAANIRDNGYKIEELIENAIREISADFFRKEYLQDYKVILFIDDLDLISTSEKNATVESVKKYCIENDTHYVITYRRNEFSYEPEIKNVRIHNFNNRQIEAFIDKFFEGTDRGQRFIQVLRESNILSKLPTTPLTITLISLLYDENNFEIPATISDIYDDFVSVLLGKLNIRNKTELLLYNIKKRLFTSLALKMLNERRFEIHFDEYRQFMNDFLTERGYTNQSDEELVDIIEQSNLLFVNEENLVSFKQQAFVEFLASLEIYHHTREHHYEKMIRNFNDVNWQNTAIFYAGHSKELVGMIDDVISNAPNDTLRDWFINTGGLGYLAQALYQTVATEREKLVQKALENMVLAFYEMKKLTVEKDNPFSEIPLPMIGDIVNFWFGENFKSITLKSTLQLSFSELSIAEQKSNEFDNDFKLLMIACTLMNPFIQSSIEFEELSKRASFIRHQLLPLMADIYLEMRVPKGLVEKDIKTKIEGAIKKKQKYISAVLKEPAYRFTDEDFKLEEGGNKSSNDSEASSVNIDPAY